MLPTQIAEKIWTIENVLSPARCDELIKHSEDIGYQEATVSLPQGATMIKGLRDNYRVTFQNSELAKSLYKKLQAGLPIICLLYTSPSPRDKRQSRMPSSA